MVSSAPDLTGRILRHERALVAISITALATLCWWYVARSAAASPNAMVAMGGPPIGALIVMWWLMMIAMMLPSAAPAILLYSRIRESRNENKALAQTWVFLTGYLTVWLLFSIIAAFAQRLFTGASMALHNHFAEGALLIGSGLYQLSPAKTACMRQCRSPAEFLSRHWRPGLDGAVWLGVRHGGLLSRMLLAAHGLAVRRRDHEHPLDCRADIAGCRREVAAARGSGPSSFRNHVAALGRRETPGLGRKRRRRPDKRALPVAAHDLGLR